MENAKEALTITSWREALRIVPTREEYSKNNIPKEARDRSYPKPEGIDYRKELLDKNAEQDFYLYHLGQMVVNKLGTLVYVIPQDDKDLEKYFRMMHLFNTGDHTAKTNDEETAAKQIDRARKVILLAFADSLSINVDENNPDYDSIQEKTVEYFQMMAKDFKFPFPEVIAGKENEEDLLPVKRSFNFYLNQAKQWAENKIDENTGKSYREQHPEPFDYYF